jgi:hypothetical protein
MIHARPIIETVILIDYLAERPEERIWAWVAHGVEEQSKMLREWRQAVLDGHNDHISVAELDAVLERKQTDKADAEEKAREAAAHDGRELENITILNTHDQAARKPKLLELYTQGFRHLSGSIHVVATQFTVDRYEGNAFREGTLDDETAVGVRGLCAGVLAVIYTEAAKAIDRSDLLDEAGAVHADLGVL